MARTVMTLTLMGLEHSSKPQQLVDLLPFFIIFWFSEAVNRDINGIWTKSFTSYHSFSTNRSCTDEAVCFVREEFAPA